MMKALVNWTIIVGLTISPCSEAACNGSLNMPAQHLIVHFGKGSSEPSVEEKARLNAWAVDMNARFPLHQWLMVDGAATPDEDTPQALASRRAVNTAKAALDAGLIRAPIEVKSEVGSFGSPSTYLPEENSATLQLSPGCPDNCCQRSGD
ncbi:hypothetical protein [Caballeronia sp. GAFFF1]|uniref:hypothetical protein n=1 Tax=Caballeronia sp. GAFFF1 TaxID=2921779 RepID=UPI0020278B22|nr:hypothetical protein [Caballeronia sp. GAFFF1]